MHTSGPEVPQQHLPNPDDALHPIVSPLTKLAMNSRCLLCCWLVLDSMGDHLMRGRRPEKLIIARRDQAALHAAAHHGPLPWFQVQRAKIVLAIAAGERSG